MLADELRQGSARLERIATERARAGRAASEGWEGPSRHRFDQERLRQSACAAHLAAQGRRLAAELEAS